jgi:hypothetical protein
MVNFYDFLNKERRLLPSVLLDVYGEISKILGSVNNDSEGFSIIYYSTRS